MSDKSGTGRWTIYVCEECDAVYGHRESCHSPLHGIVDPKPVEVVAIDTLLSNEAVERVARRLSGAPPEIPATRLGKDITWARILIGDAIAAAKTGEHVAYTEPVQGRYGVGCETCGWKSDETYAHIDDARVEGRAHEAASSGDQR